MKKCAHVKIILKTLYRAKTKHTSSDYSLFTHCSFDATKNRLDSYKGKDGMKMLSKDLREDAVEILGYEKKETILRTDKENDSYEEQKVCYICKKEFSTDKDDENAFKLYHKARDNCHYARKFRGSAHSICNLRYKTTKKFPVVFHNGSTYDYHFIINQLEFDGQVKCLRENTGKYITFSVFFKLDNGKTITYKLKFINSFRFMSSKLSDLVDNLSEKIYWDNCTDCKSRLDYMTTKDNQLIFGCFDCKKNYQKDFNKDLINSFANKYQFCNGDINKFVLLLRKGVYPYEYMDSWERFDETSLTDKKYFYSELYLKDITDKDYTHAQKELKFKNLGDYHDLYGQSDTYCLQMYLKTLETNELKYMNLILLIFCLHLE